LQIWPGFPLDRQGVGRRYPHLFRPRFSTVHGKNTPHLGKHDHWAAIWTEVDVDI